MREERKGREFSEKPRSVEEWIAQIESYWKNIPEFEVDPEKLRHLAIICDGNRRAATEKGFSNPFDGHRGGLSVLEGIVNACQKWEIKTVTFWVFSTENWKREDGTVEFLMGRLFPEALKKVNIDEFNREGVRFWHLGRKDRIAPSMRREVENIEKETASNTQFNLNIALDHGGRDELVRAFQKMLANGVSQEEVNEELVSSYLDTGGLPDPDLIIRTSGEMRGSGFMVWQAGYSEWYYTKKYFPDLIPSDLIEAIQDFNRRKRRFGGDAKEKN